MTLSLVPRNAESWRRVIAVAQFRPLARDSILKYFQAEVERLAASMIRSKDPRTKGTYRCAMARFSSQPNSAGKTRHSAVAKPCAKISAVAAAGEVRGQTLRAKH